MKVVKHVVVFTLKSELNVEKQTIMTDFRDGILALKNIIPCIVDIEVGFNINESERGDICLCGTFRNLDDVRQYSVHPSHTTVTGKLKPYIEARVCSDYVVEE